MSAKKRRRKGKKKKARFDKYEMYQRSVQEPEADIEFIQEVFEAKNGCPARSLREDFCGTAYLSCEWVSSHPENRAWGVDLDDEPLTWGEQHNAALLTDEQRRRLTLVPGNVLDRQDPPVDVIVAFNFSYFAFKSRQQMIEYARVAHRNLSPRGLFVLDIYGGPEAQQLMEEHTEHEGFTYVWDQDEFDAIKQGMMCYIHFDLPEGKRMQKAFTYDWRLWTLPELQEILLDAGFSSSEVYWEGVDEDSGEGNGIFTKEGSAENTDSWIAYVVGIK